jgi:predicted CopG family antitoxin
MYAITFTIGMKKDDRISVSISKATHRELKRVGQMGESFDAVIRRLLYRRKEEN